MFFVISTETSHLAPDVTVALTLQWNQDIPQIEGWWECLHVGEEGGRLNTEAIMQYLM